MKENFIIGKKEHSINDGSRICLSKFCGLKAGDKVIILAMADYIEVWEQDVFYGKLEKMKRLIDVENITKCIFKSDILVYDGNRINLPRDLVGKYGLNGRVIEEGAGDHIRIWNKDKYHGVLSEYGNFVKLGAFTKLFITKYLDSSNIDKVVLIMRRDFIECWDNAKIIHLKKKIEKSLAESKTPEEVEFNHEKLTKILNILYYGRRQIYFSHSNYVSKFIYLGVEVVDRYHLSNDVVLEKRADHFRIWEPSKYKIYQHEQEQEQLRNMFIQKVKARRLEKKANEN